MAALSEHQALVALNMVKGIGAVTVKALVNAFGSASAVFDASASDLEAVPGIGKAKAASFAEGFKAVDPVKEEADAEILGIKIITWGDKDYPTLLSKIYDPPLAIYYHGDATAFLRASISIIGTRAPSIYGRETAQRLSYGLAAAGYAVVSGLAVGIDAEAHRGAIMAKGRTIGVIGSALDCFYPNENRKLANDIIRHHGIVMSEYPLGRPADKQTFPMRNRIISGLSAGVVVVEAASGSGTLITVKQAMDQGRVVMAVPGKIDSPTSKACHKLIRDGATLVTCVDDIVEACQSLIPMRPHTSQATEAKNSPAANLSREEKSVLAALGHSEKSIEELAMSTGINIGRLNGLLVTLQVKRRLKILPTGYVAPVRSPR